MNKKKQVFTLTLIWKKSVFPQLWSLKQSFWFVKKMECTMDHVNRPCFELFLSTGKWLLCCDWLLFRWGKSMNVWNLRKTLELISLSIQLLLLLYFCVSNTETGGFSKLNYNQKHLIWWFTHKSTQTIRQRLIWWWERRSVERRPNVS